MDDTIKNTGFDNLVNYQTVYSNSAVAPCVIQNSADPDSLASRIQNRELVYYIFLIESLK